MLIDSHCHLDTKVWGTDTEVDTVVSRARASGVDRMIAIGSGYGFDAAAKAVAVAERHPGCVGCSVGMHPHDAKEFTEEGFKRLIELASRPCVLALGEMGLDFHYDFSPRALQAEVFVRQLKAARQLQLPIIIHDRESAGETMRLLDEERAWELGVLYHCYTGTVSEMQQIVERGGYISIPGIVTFKNAEEVREVARSVPINRLLIETDSPFLTPVPHRGKRNEPAYVALVAAAVAALRTMPVEEFSSIAAQNTLDFFRWA